MCFLPTVLFAPAEFACNLNGQKYNCRAQSTDFDNLLAGITGLALTSLWRARYRLRPLIYHILDRPLPRRYRFLSVAMAGKLDLHRVHLP
jgi:hypothetical protein